MARRPAASSRTRMNAVDVRDAEDGVRVVPVSPTEANARRFALSNRERRVVIAVVDFAIGALACYIAFAALRHPHLTQLSFFDPLVIGGFWVISLLAADGYASEIPSNRNASGFAVLKA